MGKSTVFLLLLLSTATVVVVVVVVVVVQASSNQLPAILHGEIKPVLSSKRLHTGNHRLTPSNRKLKRKRHFRVFSSLF